MHVSLLQSQCMKDPSRIPQSEGEGLTYAQGPHVICMVKFFWARADV